MNHHAGIWQGKTFTFGTTAEQHGAHGGLETDTDSLDIWLDVIHGVDNGETIVNRAAW